MMKRRAAIACVVLFFLPFATTQLARGDNGRGRHRKMYAVPVPGKVEIDGKFDDWDNSARVQMYVMSETADQQSAHFALMYDEAAVYVAGSVRDPSPMMNRHDPAVDPDKGWDADSCQFRMTLDPAQGYPLNDGTDNPKENDQIAHLTLWYYTDKKLPCLHVQHSMAYKNADDQPKGVVPADQFQAAYLPSDDGKGYTFEYRIPWSTLKARSAPKGGDLVAGTVQFNWSSEDGLKTGGGSAWCYDVMSGPGFAFQSTACWGKIIFSPKGKLAADLVDEGITVEKPLPLKFSYDVPEDSEISLQLFDQRSMMVRTLIAQEKRTAGHHEEAWDGLDSFGNPLPAGSYTVKGVYHRPITQKFLFSAHNSGQPPYKTDDNTGGWGGDHGIPQTVYAVGDSVLMSWNAAESGWGIIRTDLEGKKLWGNRHCATDLASDGERIFVIGDGGFNDAEFVKIFDLKDGRPINWGEGADSRSSLVPPAGGNKETDVATGVACGGGLVYVSIGARNLVALYEVPSGKLKDAWNVPKPGRLAVRADGAALVVSGEKVLIATKDSATDFTAERLDHPSGITIDSAGNVLVANLGQLQSVSVFDAKGDYLNLRHVGTPGGRPTVGNYDPSGMLYPGGISVDRNGRLWVAEMGDSPKRISVWDVKTGEFYYEFFGGSSYFAYAWIDPRKPDELYCHNVLWNVNWETNKVKPRSTIWRATQPNQPQEISPTGYNGHIRVFTAKNGKQYAFGNSFWAQFIWMRDGDIFKPLAGVISINRGYVYFGAQSPYEVFKDEHKYPNGTYFWQDANDDQRIDAEEIVPTDGKPEMSYLFRWIDGDLNAYSFPGTVLRPVRVEPDGRPVYDFAKLEKKEWGQPNPIAQDMWADLQEYRDDDWYTLVDGNGSLAQPGLLARWSADGKTMRWGYSPIVAWRAALNLPIVTPGRLHGLTQQLAFAGDFTGACTYFGTYHIFTRDGVYVAMIMRDSRMGGLGADVTASETITGQLVKPDGMNRYFLLAGDQDGRVTEVFGLDTVKPLPAITYQHTEAAFKTVTDAQTAYLAQLSKGHRLEIVRGRPAIETAGGVGKSVDSNRGFIARAAYDAKNLYLQYDVTGPFELTNEINDPQRLFKGGNCLDIQIATDASADPERKTPAPGDIRLLVTRQAGKAFVVVYRPKVKGFAGQPITLISPTGKESFDVIEPIEAVTLDYAKTVGGFRAIVTIPLEFLGIASALAPDQEIRMDLGYLWGNETGNAIASRAYWSNTSFSAGITADIPNESRLEPAEWGKARVE